MPAQINFECPDVLQSEVLEPIQKHIDVSFVRQYAEVLFKKGLILNVFDFILQLPRWIWP